MNSKNDVITKMIVGLIPVFMMGCVPLLDWSGKVMMRGDIRDLFERFEVSSDDIRCYPVSGHRIGFCTSTLSSEEVDRLVRELALEQVDVYSDPGYTPGRANLSAEINDLEMGCLSLSTFANRTSIESYGSYKQEASIRQLDLNSAGTFVSFFLLYNVETGEACLQAGYGYG